MLGPLATLTKRLNLRRAEEIVHIWTVSLILSFWPYDHFSYIEPFLYSCLFSRMVWSELCYFPFCYIGRHGTLRKV